MADPKHRNWVATKHVLRYLHGTFYYGIRYASNRGVLLLGYTDSDWGGNIIDQKRNSGYCYRLGSSMISWSSKKQVLVSQSTTEAEYIATSTTCREAVWLKNLLERLFSEKLEPTLIRHEKKIYIKISENPVFHDKLKHIEIKYHFIRYMVQKGTIKLQQIATDEKIVDVLTKPLSIMKFKYF